MGDEAPLDELLILYIVSSTLEFMTTPKRRILSFSFTLLCVNANVIFGLYRVFSIT